jgi:hypothetical protein
MNIKVSEINKMVGIHVETKFFPFKHTSILEIAYLCYWLRSPAHTLSLFLCYKTGWESVLTPIGATPGMSQNTMLDEFNN